MILADENIDSFIIESIRNIPVEVISIKESYRGISDDKIISIAQNPPKIILTEDKDFGEWVFAHHIKNISVLFVRYTYNEKEIIIKILIELIKYRVEELFNKFTVVTATKIRSRVI